MEFYVEILPFINLSFLPSHKMSLPVCRVCLSSKIMTVHSVTDIQLRDIYEKLTGTQFSSEDNMPKTLCDYCYWQLHQCCKLTATALYSDKMLRKVLDCNMKNGLKYINSLPKSRHLTITTLKSFSFNGELNETTFEYPRQLMMICEKDLPKPILGSRTDYIQEKPDIIITSHVTKPSVRTKSQEKTPVKKQYGPIANQLSLQCLLTGNPGLVIKKQKKPQPTINKQLIKQEILETTNETQHKKIELQYEIQATRQEKKDLEPETFNITKGHEINTKQVNQPCKIEIIDKNSQSGDTFDHLQFNAVSEPTTVSETKQPIFFFCNICKKLFKTWESLSEHQKSHKKSKHILSKDFLSKDILSKDILSKKKEPTLCLICNKYVMSMSSHKRVHSNERYVCDICGHKSRSKHNLGTHLRVHTDEPEIVCKVCNKGFKHKSSYVYHKYIHTGERPFSCHICGGTYKQGGQVREHIRFVHEGLKQFCCDICGKKFCKKDKLLNHLNAHANIKPFSCDKCKKMFRTASVMRRHVARYCKVNK